MTTIASLEVIPHSQQRYPTCGDWILGQGGELLVLVSEMKDEDSEFLVALHELVECYLCKKAGVTDEQVTEFDKAFEVKRTSGNTDEPGDDPKAPYRTQHQCATLIEMIVCREMGKDWKEHEENVNRL